MKITKTIVYNLPRTPCKDPKMEITLELLETYSSRSQETHPYFVEDNLEQNNFHCWY